MLSQRNLLVLNLVVLLAVGVLGARRNEDPFTNLRRMEERLTARIEALGEQLEECTAERYRRNQCAPGDAPFELAVTVCGGMGLEASLEGKYSVEAKFSGQGGIGWKAAVDADLKAEGSIPIILGVGPVPVAILPTELAVGGSGKGELGIEGCIEGVRAPLSAYFTREQILTLIDKLEVGSQGLATAIGAAAGALGDVQTAGAGGFSRALDTQRLADAIGAARSFGSAEFGGADPLAVFSSPSVTALRETLPVSRFSERLLADPGAVLSRIDPGAGSLCGGVAGLPSIGGRLDGVCDFADSLPDVTSQVAMLERVNRMHDQIQDLPDVIRFLIQEALPDVPAPQPVLPPSSWFCTRFPRLCIFQ
jgi:hypothetical protein